MPKKYMIANFKMNQTPTETMQYVREFEVQPSISNRALHLPTVVLCPPAINLFAAVQVLQNNSVHFGIQNVNQNQKGAFTGETSVAMAKTCGATYVLVGHSERRTLFNETNVIVSEKLNAILAQGLTAVLCIGETLMERENNMFESIVTNQLSSALNNISKEDMTNIIIAYEPVWAIGTGVSANELQIEEAAKLIRSIISKLYDNQIANNISILYGGSLSLKNKHFASLNLIDGGLVGGASLDPVGFAQLCNF